MGCGKKAKALNGSPERPVAIGEIKPREVATAAKSARKKDKAARHDFHCSVCGHSSPNRFHFCPGPRLVSYQEQRKAGCNRCGFAKDNICTKMKEKYPERDCAIDIGIAMPEAGCPIHIWEKVLISCQKCGSVSFDEKGLRSCPVCSKHAKACKTPWKFSSVDTPLVATKPLAVVTIAAGQRSLDLLKLTGPTMERYAAKIGADFHAVTTNTEERYPVGNKFRLKSLVENYERTLFLDVDVWVKKDADNLFDVVPIRTVGVHCDWTKNTDRKWMKKVSQQISEEQGVEYKKIRTLNSGVIVFDREHLDIWTPPPLPSNPTHLTEQVWVEYNILNQRVPVTYLDPKYNTQWWFSDFKELESQAHILHLAACQHEERLYRMQKYQMEDL
jgi:hypothetical protein